MSRRVRNSADRRAVLSPPARGFAGKIPSCLRRGGTEGDGVVEEVSMLRAGEHATRCSESWPGVAPKVTGWWEIPSTFSPHLLYGPLAGPSDFLCSPKESHQRKGIPGSSPLPRELVAVPPVLLDRPGGPRNSRKGSTLTSRSGANLLTLQPALSQLTQSAPDRPGSNYSQRSGRKADPANGPAANESSRTPYPVCDCSGGHPMNHPHPALPLMGRENSK
jgi:hypothetical protein